MRLTAFSDVSLRVLMLLSGLGGEQISTQKIAEGVGTPYNHVAKSVAFLANMGLVESTRGRTGGVRLSEAGTRATVGQVLRASEGDIPMVECEGGANECPMRHACSLKKILANAREEFFKMLDSVVISELPNEQQMGPVFLELGLGPLAQTKKLPQASFVS
ncbi:MAG: Rrf2 family transcriptional regulator [Rothia sp. (in: high G+C Gram-positive bacteria)]|uniref:RrF2 family transcriptional regulator n=1 Tax=Rothia sp. (in: high G+C Gram-positive bacteria) TaxID=1885016 RepID=UPI0026F8BA0F|nr:Rrf2 family transcriptional regulator [Rothia sp. (in: high G+C Gram-positive bacteria)]